MPVQFLQLEPFNNLFSDLLNIRIVMIRCDQEAFVLAGVYTVYGHRKVMAVSSRVGLENSENKAPSGSALSWQPRSCLVVFGKQFLAGKQVLHSSGHQEVKCSGDVSCTCTDTREVCIAPVGCTRRQAVQVFSHLQPSIL